MTLRRGRLALVVSLVAATSGGCGRKRESLAPPSPPETPRSCSAPSIAVQPRLFAAAAGPGPAADLVVVELDGVPGVDVVASRGFPHAQGSVVVHHDSLASPPPTPEVIENMKSNGGVAVADLGGDSCPDLAVAYEAREQCPDPKVPAARPYVPERVGVDVYLATKRDGRCELDRSPMNLKMPACDACAFTVGTRVAAGDFDGDSRQDLAVAQIKCSYRQPVEQYICTATGSSEAPFTCRATQAHLGGVLDVLGLDVDGDTKGDVLFGGVGVGPTAAVGANQVWTHPDAWGLLVLGTGQELVVGATDPTRASGNVPNLLDLELLPNGPGTRPRVAAVFGDHKCSGECTAAAVAKVFELQLSPDRARVDAKVLWTSEGACLGLLQAVEAVRLQPDAANPALILSYLSGTRAAREPGSLVIVPGTATGWGGPETWRSIAEVYVHAIAAIPRQDGSGLDDLLYSPFTNEPGPIYQVAGADLLSPQ